MSVERAHSSVENLIAGHVAASFRQKTERSEAESTAARIRSRITDRFQSSMLSDQDNAPPAIAALRRSLTEAFSSTQVFGSTQDRAEQLALLQTRLEELRRSAIAASPPARQGALQVDLLLERERLIMKNELTEGFGRVETWLVSLAVLALVLLKAIGFLWALPILALGIGRSFHLDRRCTKRLARIAEIDALTAPADQTPRT